LWLVVISAIASALQYFVKFWSQLDVRLKQRRLRLSIVEGKKKPQEDVAAS
jgi:hypothetical protein